METWATLIGEPLMSARKTRIFGRGVNPINFVSASDVAQFVARAAQETRMQGERFELGGPQNLTMRQVAQAIMSATKISGKVNAVPLPMMQLMAVLMRPLNATLVRQVQAGIVMDTRDMSFDPAVMRHRYPSMPYTSLAEVVRRDFGPGV
jgi:nucleoside-diphosphate-sugar epimerase